MSHKHAMVKRVVNDRIVLAALMALGLCACQTVKIPDYNDVKSPEFTENAASISQSFPRLKDVPGAPTDIRSDDQWDKDAKALQALRTRSKGSDFYMTTAEVDTDASYEALKAKAQAYKKDDPKSGPVTGFPDYRSKR